MVGGCSSSSSSTTSTDSGQPYILNASGLLLNGNDSKVVVPDAADLFLGSESFTLEAWVKAYPRNYFQWIFVKGTVSPDIDYCLGIDRNDHFTFFANRSAMNLTDEQTSIRAGAYYHIAVVMIRTQGPHRCSSMAFGPHRDQSSVHPIA